MQRKGNQCGLESSSQACGEVRYKASTDGYRGVLVRGKKGSLFRRRPWRKMV